MRYTCMYVRKLAFFYAQLFFIIINSSGRNDDNIKIFVEENVNVSLVCFVHLFLRGGGIARCVSTIKL